MKSYFDLFIYHEGGSELDMATEQAELDLKVWE